MLHASVHAWHSATAASCNDHAGLAVNEAICLFDTKYTMCMSQRFSSSCGFRVALAICMCVLADGAFIITGSCMQKTTQQEAAALLAGQELLAEEEREQARIAAKKAKKNRAKAKSGAKPTPSRNSVQELPPLQPDSHVHPPQAHASQEAEHEHKYDELFRSSPNAGDKSLVDQPAASATSAPELNPSNISTSNSIGTTSMGPTHEAGYHTKKGKKGSVLPAYLAEMPAMATESVIVEPGMPNESSGLATESSGLAGESPSLAAESSSFFSCFGSSVLEQKVFHLMMCPLTQVQSLCPRLIGQP